MKALVTGASGFLGGHLSSYLERAGWEVHRLVRARGQEDVDARSCSESRMHIYSGSYECLHEALSSAKPDVVFHLASKFSASHHPTDLRDLVDSNILLGLQLAEAMVHTGVRNLVNTGTSWQCFSNEHYRPVNLYAATKQAYEDLLLFYADAHKLHAISLLLFDTYGPKDGRGKLLSALLGSGTAPEPLKLTPGDQLIELVHVSDVCRAFEVAYDLLVNSKPRGPLRYAVNSDERLSLKALIDVCQRLTGKSLSMELGARPYREREVMVPPSNLQRLPGWSPRVRLEDGLREIISEMSQT